MKKMISLCLIACASLTSSTMIGMFIRQLQNHSKKIAASPKKYHTSTDTILFQLMTKVDRQNSLINQQISSSQAIHAKLDILIKNANIENISETSKEQPHRLVEMEHLPYESKYSREFDAYHAQLADRT